MIIIARFCDTRISSNNNKSPQARGKATRQTAKGTAINYQEGFKTEKGWEGGSFVIYSMGRMEWYRVSWCRGQVQSPNDVLYYSQLSPCGSPDDTDSS